MGRVDRGWGTFLRGEVATCQPDVPFYTPDGWEGTAFFQRLGLITVVTSGYRWDSGATDA